MSVELEEGTESRSWAAATWLIWVAGGLLVYALSSGPVLWLVARGHIRPGYPLGGAVNRLVLVIYQPLASTYHQTLLHKPIGLYYHLWAPSLVDSNGNTIP